jgi:hypothetical protein
LSLFEYIMVLTSILIGLGIAELLYGVVRLLRTEFKERFFLPQAIWALFIFLHLIIIWWTRWDLHENFEWNFLQLLLSLAAPILLFILAGLIFAKNKPSRDHYYQQRTSFFNILAVIIVINFFHETLIEKSPILGLATPLLLIMFLATLAARFSDKDWVQSLAAFICISLLGLFIGMTVFSLN